MWGVCGVLVFSSAVTSRRGGQRYREVRANACHLSQLIAGLHVVLLSRLVQALTAEYHARACDPLFHYYFLRAIEAQKAHRLPALCFDG